MDIQRVLYLFCLWCAASLCVSVTAYLVLEILLRLFRGNLNRVDTMDTFDDVVHVVQEVQRQTKHKFKMELNLRLDKHDYPDLESGSIEMMSEDQFREEKHF